MNLERLISYITSLPSGLRWRISLLVAAAMLGLWMLLAKKPWLVKVVDRPRVEEFFTIYSWYGAGAAMVVLVGLAVIAPWWAGRDVQPGPTRLTGQCSRWFWPLVGLAMLSSAIFSFPRLGHSLWDDEEYNVRMSILGRYNIQKGDEPLKFRKLSWTETLAEYREPNNHVLHSLLAKFSLQAWQTFLKKSDSLRFSETALRIPAFIFGILSVASLALLLKDLGRPGAGVLAAFLMAMHPWHVRYTSECRGYSLVLFIVPLVFLFWRRSMLGGLWAWWAPLAVAQFALIYTYPGALFILIVLNLAALPLIFFSEQTAKPFSVQSGRWFAANALTAVPTLFLMLPLLPQVKDYMAYETARNFTIGWAWVSNALWHFVAGVAWTRGSVDGAVYPELAYHFSQALWVPMLAAGIAALMGIVGAIWFIRKGPVETVILLAIVLPAVVTVIFARLRTHLIYESYVIAALPGFIALVACGLWTLGTLLVPGRRQRLGLPTICALLLLAFFAFTQPTRGWMMTRSLQPIRESSLASRGTFNLKDESASRIITASFSIPPYLYDPRAIRLESTAQFIDLIRTAEKLDRPLVMNIGMPWAARDYSPAMWKLINDPLLFFQDPRFLGWDPGLDRIVARYIPGSALGYDFSEALTKDR